MFEKICCIGLGYVGLPTAVVLSSQKTYVHGCDISQHAVDLINTGRAHIEENGMDELLAQSVKDGFLVADTKPCAADAFLIAVPTPFNADKTPDMSYVVSAARSLTSVLKPGDLVVLESTSPVGSTEMIRSIIQEERPDLISDTGTPQEDEVLFAYCPERILPGNTMKELRENSRCLGGLTPDAAKRAKELYEIFCTGELFLTDSKTAEMVKLGENSFRDINIAFSNEMSRICENNNVNVHEFIKLANKHPRVNILSPGVGVGGHCIPVDPWFLIAQNPKEAKILLQARQINDSTPLLYAQRIYDALSKSQGKVGILGLTYKPDVDDFRCSPSLELAEALLKKIKGRVIAHDPFAHQLKKMPEGLLMYEDINSLLQEVEMLIVATPHTLYKNIDLSGFSLGVNLFDPSGCVQKI